MRKLLMSSRVIECVSYSLVEFGHDGTIFTLGYSRNKETDFSHFRNE